MDYASSIFIRKNVFGFAISHKLFILTLSNTKKLKHQRTKGKKIVSAFHLEFKEPFPCHQVTMAYAEKTISRFLFYYL